METKKVSINRAPVMTLWAAVVAERLGFDRAEALTLAKVVTGLNAQSKGQRLGIYEPSEEKIEEKAEKARQRKTDEIYSVKLLGRNVPALNTPGGVRAAEEGKAVNPESVERYLENKFGDTLNTVREAMEELAQSVDEDELSRRAYSFYEQFRPEIPEGKKGWGAKGELDLGYIRSLARSEA